ncbi:hypothetical protein ncot_16240 [Nocardioides sp. JQ2195]|uniref:hypothetical protein n=1 Tax=Nocardioides sp. JQ2195 TaxID=2592334 RepID=UPI00143E914F|nr:hypothetical protein [Nocardioides sp. JQ2195]QIX27966.1 hypothetical protein ncot_16240 [Nocardioides sp. JQ2195]
MGTSAVSPDSRLCPTWLPAALLLLDALWLLDALLLPDALWWPWGGVSRLGSGPGVVRGSGTAAGVMLPEVPGLVVAELGEPLAVPALGVLLALLAVPVPALGVLLALPVPVVLGALLAVFGMLLVLEPALAVVLLTCEPALAVVLLTCEPALAVVSLALVLLVPALETVVGLVGLGARVPLPSGPVGAVMMPVARRSRPIRIIPTNRQAAAPRQARPRKVQAPDSPPRAERPKSIAANTR